MRIFPYLTKHTCPKCRVSLARDPDHRALTGGSSAEVPGTGGAREGS